MTLGFYKSYQELFTGCLFCYTGEVNSDGKLADIMGNYHGTIYNATKTGTDKFGVANKAHVFNGTTAYVATGYAPNSLTEFSIVMWLNATSTSWRMGSRTNDGGTPPFIEFFPGNSEGSYAAHMRVYNGGNRDVLIYHSILPLTNVWQMRVYTFKASTATNGFKFYVNGVLSGYADTSYALSTTTGNYAFYLGATYRGDVGAYNFYTGSIGETMFFNRTLSAVEVKTLYDLTSKKYLYPLVSPRGVE